MKKNTVSVGLIGFGTVGSGTVRILLDNSDVIGERSGFSIGIRKIADLDIIRDRGIELPAGVLTTDAASVINDPDIDIVVELIGGIHPAKEFILQAIRRGKHVVTANKALLATEGNELFAEAERAGVDIRFEASVAGGIPIIKILTEGLIANRIDAVYGIINGTANYIFTKMTDDKMEFGDAATARLCRSRSDI
jgi:homoserine dehydrogenase